MKFSFVARIALAPSLLLTLPALPLTGCSSKAQTQNPGTPDDGTGGTTDPGTGTQSGKNPYGVAYPTEGIGHDARHGTTRGNVMRNFKFLGYPNPEQQTQTDTAQGLQTVSLADFFDPEQREYKVIHINVGAVWCNPCNQEAKELTSIAPALHGEKVVFLQALSDGPSQGTGATQADLDGWILKQKSNFTELLDPNVKNLGEFFDAAAVPFNADLDARTMEILAQGTGYSGHIQTDVEKWVAWVDGNPPSY